MKQAVCDLEERTRAIGRKLTLENDMRDTLRMIGSDLEEMDQRISAEIPKLDRLAQKLAVLKEKTR